MRRGRIRDLACVLIWLLCACGGRDDDLASSPADGGASAHSGSGGSSPSGSGGKSAMNGTNTDAGAHQSASSGGSGATMGGGSGGRAAVHDAGGVQGAVGTGGASTADDAGSAPTTCPGQKPDATNTGVPAGVDLTVVDHDVTVSDDDTLLDAQDIHGFLSSTPAACT